MRGEGGIGPPGRCLFGTLVTAPMRKYALVQFSCVSLFFTTIKKYGLIVSKNLFHTNPGGERNRRPVLAFIFDLVYPAAEPSSNPHLPSEVISVVTPPIVILRTETEIITDKTTRKNTEHIHPQTLYSVVTPPQFA
jgi:hypothetical protein